MCFLCEKKFVDFLFSICVLPSNRTSMSSTKPNVKPKDKRTQTDAARLWNCHIKKVTFFGKEDPLNPGIWVGGFICKHEGPFGGSLYIVNVSGTQLNEPVHIFGTPKLAYPYKSVSDHTYALPSNEEAKHAFFSNKWNGMNVLIFKYHDNGGKVFVSMKSKGVPFLDDGPFGKFLTLSKEALKWDNNTKEPLDLPKLATLKDPKVQSETFELCGTREPHLVHYDFELELEPLFTTNHQVQIAPVIGVSKHASEVGPLEYDEGKVEALCKKFQMEDEAQNEAFRKKRGLVTKYEFGHFILEGRVLYCLDENGFIINRTMYKIKPSSIEETHWGSFNLDMQGRVREAMEKLVERERPFSEQNLQSELDMGPKEWGKFGRSAWAYASTLHALGKSLPFVKNDNRRLLILIGVHGAGKSTLAKELEKLGWIIAGKEKQESDENIEGQLNRIWRNSTDAKVVVDSLNLIAPKRRVCVDIAKNNGVLKVDAMFFNISEGVWRPRLNPETYDDAELAIHAHKISKTTPNEGFSSEIVVSDEDDLVQVAKKLDEGVIRKPEAV